MEKLSTKQRVQFDFSPEALRRLEHLQETLDATTKAEVVRNALKLYEWFTQIDQEATIEVKESDGKSLFCIPLKILLS